MPKLSLYSVKLVREGSMPYPHPLGHKITSNSSAASLIAHYLKDADREHFVVVLLSTKHHVTGLHTAHVGTLDAAAVHPREVFKAAILGSASAIMVAHNHPSGEVKPSADDKAMTHSPVKAGGLLGIPVLDHIIIGWNFEGTEYTHFSFSAENMLRE